MRTTILALVIAIGASATANADGLLYQLPKDGTSAKFTMKMKMTAAGRETTAEGTLNMCLIGQEKVKGKTCRWIEFQVEMNVEGKEVQTATKVLIPEKYLKKGENPSAFTQKIITKNETGKVETIDDINNPRAGPITTFLCGPLEMAKKLAPAELKTPFGKIKCPGVSGKLEILQGEQTVTMAMTVRTNPKAPFGVVACEMQFDLSRNGEKFATGMFTLTLADVGKDAKSKVGNP